MKNITNYIKNIGASVALAYAVALGTGCATTKHAVAYHPSMPSVQTKSLEEIANTSAFPVQTADAKIAKDIPGGYEPNIYLPLNDGSFVRVAQASSDIALIVDAKTQQAYANVLETIAPDQKTMTRTYTVADPAQSIVYGVGYTVDDSTTHCRFLVDVKREKYPGKYTDVSLTLEQVDKSQSPYTSQDRAKPIGLGVQSGLNGAAASVYGGALGFGVATFVTPAVDMARSQLRSRPRINEQNIDSPNQAYEADITLRKRFATGHNIVVPYEFKAKNGSVVTGTAYLALQPSLNIGELMHRATYDRATNTLNFKIKPEQLDLFTSFMYFAGSFAGYKNAEPSSSDATGGVIGGPGGNP
jgi:hypothetical protein